MMVFTELFSRFFDTFFSILLSKNNKNLSFEVLFDSASVCFAVFFWCPQPATLQMICMVSVLTAHSLIVRLGCSSAHRAFKNQSEAVGRSLANKQKLLKSSKGKSLGCGSKIPGTQKKKKKKRSVKGKTNKTCGLQGFSF